MKIIAIKNKKNLGQALVEMALVLPIFIFTIIVIVDIARLIHCQSTLNYQCVQAVQIASKRILPLISNKTFNQYTHSSKQSIINEFWKYQSPIMAKERYNSYFKDKLPIITDCGNNEHIVTVTATYDINILTPLLSSLIGEKKEKKKNIITLSASASRHKE